jgi:hypothetical protein
LTFKPTKPNAGIQLEEGEVLVHKLWDTLLRRTVAGAPTLEALSSHHVVDAPWRSDREERRVEIIAVIELN